MKTTTLCVFLLALISAGCKDQKPYKVPTPSSSDRLFDSQRDALEKAKTVEGSIEQSAAAQREAIDANK